MNTACAMCKENTTALPGGHADHQASVDGITAHRPAGGLAVAWTASPACGRSRLVPRECGTAALVQDDGSCGGQCASFQGDTAHVWCRDWKAMAGEAAL
jgi:hypothetical protein